VKNGDFPHIARPGPSPEEPDLQAGENHRWGKDYRVPDLPGKISGNHVVITSDEAIILSAASKP
jgi:hypothetical protein